MKICVIIVIIGFVLVVIMLVEILIYCIFFMVLGCLLMWFVLWFFVMVDFGKFIKVGFLLLIMVIVGGVVMLWVCGVI